MNRPADEPIALSNTTADIRLIERWLPIAALGIESVRERTPMTPYPAPNRLHVWWARRPLVASRAAILASILPANADRESFMHALGIHGDPVSVRRRLDLAKRTGERFGANPYGYNRAFQHVPDAKDRAVLRDAANALGSSAIFVLDPTAGGGAIPFEAARLGLNTFANDLNPVAALLEKATIEFPLKHGSSLGSTFREVADEFIRRATPKFAGVFPPEKSDTQVVGYLWARTIRCPYCNGLVPLSPNWRLAPDGTGVRLIPQLGSGPGSFGRVCKFQIVSDIGDQSAGTVAGGDGTCPFSDCARVIDGDDIKRQAQAGEMGDQLFAVLFKRKIATKTKTGKRGRDKVERGYRAPRQEDDNAEAIEAYLGERLPEWQALDIIPSELIPNGLKTSEPLRYGMRRWSDMFSPRQLLGHGLAAQVYRDMLEDDRTAGVLNDLRRAGYVYLSFALSKMLNWNSRLSSWNVNAGTMRSVFDRHDLAFKWSYAEMPPLITGAGYDWALREVGKCIKELVELVNPNGGREPDLLASSIPVTMPTTNISCKSGDNLDHIADGTVDVVVMDPPYYDNVMYAELSDFFYVWLKRTAGHIVPALFTRNLTDKENEAVANPAKFEGQKGVQALAGRDYQERMQRIFEECRRVLTGC